MTLNELLFQRIYVFIKYWLSSFVGAGLLFLLCPCKCSLMAHKKGKMAGLLKLPMATVYQWVRGHGSRRIALQNRTCPNQEEGEMCHSRRWREFYTPATYME